jgi:hypothetical protein
MCRGSWFLKKGPYLCTPPESTGFGPRKAALSGRRKLKNKVGKSKKVLTFAPRIALTESDSQQAKRKEKINFSLKLANSEIPLTFALPIARKGNERKKHRLVTATLSRQQGWYTFFECLEKTNSKGCFQ